MPDPRILDGSADWPAGHRRVMLAFRLGKAAAMPNYRLEGQAVVASAFEAWSQVARVQFV